MYDINASNLSNDHTAQVKTSIHIIKGNKGDIYIIQIIFRNILLSNSSGPNLWIILCSAQVHIHLYIIGYPKYGQ